MVDRAIPWMDLRRAVHRAAVHVPGLYSMLRKAAWGKFPVTAFASDPHSDGPRCIHADAKVGLMSRREVGWGEGQYESTHALLS